MISRDVLFAMERVRMNQGNKCQWSGCGDTEDIQVHHIFPRREYPELAAIERYMICYCDKHHTLWHWHYEKKISSQVTYWANHHRSMSSSIFDQIEQEAQNQTKFLKIQPNEPIVLKFDASKVRIVDREYKDGKKSKAVEYTVINVNSGNEKILTLSLSWALNVNELIKAGHTNIKVLRRGSGLDTSYSFVPV